MVRLRYILAVLCSLFIISVPALCASAEEGLPIVDGWTCGDVRAVKLDTVSGNQGLWLERSCRTESGTPFKAILMTGRGAAAHAIPSVGEGSIQSDGLMGTGSTYRTLSIDGRAAVLEMHPTLGISLAVFMEGAVLTIESPAWALSDDEAISAAARLIEARSSRQR